MSEAEDLSRAAVELGGDAVQIGLSEAAQIHSPGQILAQGPVGILVAGSLQGLRGSQKNTSTPVSA